MISHNDITILPYDPDYDLSEILYKFRNINRARLTDFLYVLIRYVPDFSGTIYDKELNACSINGNTIKLRLHNFEIDVIDGKLPDKCKDDVSDVYFLERYVLPHTYKNTFLMAPDEYGPLSRAINGTLLRHRNNGMISMFHKGQYVSQLELIELSNEFLFDPLSIHEIMDNMGTLNIKIMADIK